jgi:hypothetical protein
MRTISMCALGLITIGGVAHAGRGHGASCAKADIRSARANAEASFREKDYASAIRSLEQLSQECSTELLSLHGTTTIDFGSVFSDLAAAYEHNGQYVECMKALAGLGVQMDPGADSLIKALDYNRKRCSKGIDVQYAIKTGGCTLSIPQAITTVAAPRALVPSGASAACLALVPGQRPPNVPDGAVVVCPVVALVWNGAKRAVERKELAVEGLAALDNEYWCGDLSSIAVGTMAGKDLVRVRGTTGAKGREWIDVFYEWNGKLLTPAVDLSE